MHIVYIGCFIDPSQAGFFEEKAKATVTVSANTFQRAFLSGFNENCMHPDLIVNAPDIGSWPKRCKKLFIPSSSSVINGMECVNVNFCNLTYFKRWSILFSIKKLLFSWLNNHQGEEVLIVVYSLLYPYLKAAIAAKNNYSNVKVCCIVLDLPEYFGDNTSLLYRVLDNDSKEIYELTKHIDSFVLLTEYMKERLKLGDRPWMLLEGIYAPQPLTPVVKHHRTILYSGKLDARFGIRELVDNFSKLKGPDYHLWVCGEGLERGYVEELCKIDSRIMFFGQVKQQRVFEMQREASLLINPRKPEGEYTKYSFPSKTMEYLASGTPTIMYRLPGMPHEYDDFIVPFNDSSDNEMRKVMEMWLNKPQEELDSFGEKARDFILNNKTAELQVSRFIAFLRSIYER